MIKELISKIEKANDSYRIGKPIMSDIQYDILIDELLALDPDNELLNKVGHKVGDESRKTKLPITMASLNKCKTIQEIKDWIRLKSISKDELVIITPKFDGLSLCVDERDFIAITRGDGEFGQKSDEHYSFIKNHLYDMSGDIGFDPFGPLHFDYTYGEVMMPKNKFLESYSNDFANPRNLVAGLLNSKTVDSSLKSSLSDCNYIKYGGVLNAKSKSLFITKKQIIDVLNDGQTEKIKYHICKVSDLTEKLLIDLFHKLSPDYEIDGVVIELNSLTLQEQLGRETSSDNPCWARAFKHASFEQSAESEVIGLSWNISKQGYLKPILHINPIRLDGVTVSNVTGNNARFVKDMGLGIGAVVRVKRSGMVIPLIVDVVKTVPFVMPSVPDIDWNENGVELVTLTETDEERFKQSVSFFKILEVDNVGEGVVRQLWDAGFDSIKSILELTPDKLHKLEGFGKRKASIVYNNIQSKIKDVELSKLQHATGIFNGLGSKKLVLLEQFDTKPTLEEVMAIEGFAETSAQFYLDGYDDFFELAKELPITIKKKVEVEPSGDDLDGMVFVFTGVRRSDLTSIIESRGGKESSSVSRNTTYLVMKSIGSGSSKEKKAIDLGVKVITVEQLEKILG